MPDQNINYRIRIDENVSSSLLKMEGIINRIGDKLDGLGKKGKSSFSGSPSKGSGGGGISGLGGFSMVGGLAALGIGIGISELKEFTTEVVTTTAKFQSLANSIKFASDTSVQGDISMRWISQMSDHFGLPLAETIQGFKTFQGAMMNTKFTSSEVRNMFGQVSTGITAMGLSADDAKGVFLALGQIMSKGKVSAEELRGQIGERIPGAFSIAARSIGVTTAELDKMMKDGKLLSEDFLPKFAAEMEKTFGIGAEGMIHSLSSELARAENAWTNLVVAIGNSDSKNVMGKTIGAWTSVLKTLEESFTPYEKTALMAQNDKIDKQLNRTQEEYKKIQDKLTGKPLSETEPIIRSFFKPKIDQTEELIGEAREGLRKIAHNNPVLSNLMKEHPENFDNDKKLVDNVMDYLQRSDAAGGKIQKEYINDDGDKIKVNSSYNKLANQRLIEGKKQAQLLEQQLEVQKGLLKLQDKELSEDYTKKRSNKTGELSGAANTHHSGAKAITVNFNGGIHIEVNATGIQDSKQALAEAVRKTLNAELVNTGIFIGT